MKRFFEIFRLEFRGVVRSWTLAMLVAAALVWTVVAPYVFTGDGTAEGAREVVVRYSLGGVFALLAVTLLASATGSVARERASRRLALTLVRPVPYAVVALGKIAAYAVTAAIVLAVAGTVETLRASPGRVCSHVYAPVLPSPREEAEAMYRIFMESPETPADVKKMKKSAVLGLLARRAREHYQTLATNDTVIWTFPACVADVPAAAARLKFSTDFNMREDVRGRFAFGSLAGSVSNITQTAVTVPLLPVATSVSNAAPPGVLAYTNLSRRNMMVRPRQDVHLLVPADAFGWNVLRACIELLGLLTLLVAFGVFLGSGLGRPAALFTAIVTLVLGELSPSVMATYHEDIKAPLGERIGFRITQFAAEATHPISALDPVERLSGDTCVEPREVARTSLLNLLLLPLAFALLTAWVMPRKEEV